MRCRTAHLPAIAVFVIASAACGPTAPPAATAPASPTLTATASISPTPATGVTATPAVTPTGTAAAAGVLSARHGFLVADTATGRLRVRAETSDVEISSFAGTIREPAVSSDGRWLAYWQPGEGSTLDRLYVAPVAGGAPTRALMTVEPDHRGGPIAWASDGAGLLAAVDSGAIPARNDRSELWTVDLATAATRRLFAIGNGKSWRPLAWDRAARLSGAAIVAGGLLEDYAVVRLDREVPALSTLPFSSFKMVITRVHASPDARYVAGVRDGNGVLWWPLAEPARRAQLQREVHASGLAWRPGTSQLGWVGGPIPSGCTLSCGGTQIVLHDVASGVRTTPWPALTSHLSYFRLDGSAAFLASSNTPDLKVIELISGRSGDLTERGVLMRPVTIDPR